MKQPEEIPFEEIPDPQLPKKLPEVEDVETTIDISIASSGGYAMDYIHDAIPYLFGIPKPKVSSDI